jgi:hypothetical protein
MPAFDTENSRQESPRRVWDNYTPAWNPNGNPPAYVTGGYVNIASPYYQPQGTAPAACCAAGQSCPGGIETTAGNCISEYPLCDYRLNSSEDMALCNVLKSWQAYQYSYFVESPSVRTTQGVQAGNSKILFADSDTDGRMKDTEVARLSGIVDGSRLIKESFYAMQVATSTAPAVAILGHWNYPQGTTKTVYVIVSCGTGVPTPSAVTLGTYQADGTTLIQNYTGAVDMQSGAPNGYVWNFPKVAWQAGVIKASATCGGTTVTDQKVTTGPVAALRLTTTTGPQGWFANGADIAMIDFEAVDSNGLRVPTDEANVTFTYSGAGTWIGGYNSGVRQSKFKANLWTEAGINRVFVRSTTTAGTYTVTATRTGLPPVTTTFTSLPFTIDSTNGGGLTTQQTQRYEVPLPTTEPTPVADPN